MPPLDGPAGTAERLILLVHYGIDWQHGWVGRHRTTYWSALLPDRIIAATFFHSTLRGWWTELATELQSEPRTRAERVELEQLLRPDSNEREVLQLLRTETQALLLRTRIATEAVRDARLSENEATSQEGLS